MHSPQFIPSLTPYTLRSLLLTLLVSVLLFLSTAQTFVHGKLYREVTKAAIACQTRSEICVRALISVARWQTPFHTTPQQAAMKAFALLQAELVPEAQKQALLWELRSALYGSRSILRSEKPGEISALLEAIDSVLIEKNTGGLIKAGSADPDYFWQLAAQGSFWLWILCILLAIWRGMTRAGVILWPHFLRYFAGGACAYGSWLYCLSQA